MTRFARYLGLTISLIAAISLSSSALAGEPVTQVVAIDTNGKTDILLAEANNNEKIFERLGIKATRRYMQAGYAGSQAGTIAVVIDYPDLASLAAASEKLDGDAEWQKYIDKVIEAGMTIESNSIWFTMTP